MFRDIEVIRLQDLEARLENEPNSLTPQEKRETSQLQARISLDSALLSGFCSIPAYFLANSFCESYANENTFNAVTSAVPALIFSAGALLLGVASAKKTYSAIQNYLDSRKSIGEK